MKNEKGITILALVFVIIIMLAIGGFAFYYGKKLIHKAELENIKTDMISIKTRAKTIVDEYNIKELETLKGVKIEDQELLNKLSIEEGYIWNRETLDEQELKNIDGDKYIVKYNLENSNDCEVYYKDGFDGEYSLTQLIEK